MPKKDGGAQMKRVRRYQRKGINLKAIAEFLGWTYHKDGIVDANYEVIVSKDKAPNVSVSVMKEAQAEGGAFIVGMQSKRLMSHMSIVVPVARTIFETFERDTPGKSTKTVKHVSIVNPNGSMVRLSDEYPQGSHAFCGDFNPEIKKRKKTKTAKAS